MVRITSSIIVYITITAILTMLFLPLAIGAQSTAARLAGIVWDPSDNPTPGVILTAVEENTGWPTEAVSDENGQYVFLALRPGFYTVSTKAKGFQQITRRHILLPVNGIITESFTLDIAAADETAPLTEKSNIYNSDLSGDVSLKDLESLPVSLRNPLILGVHLSGVQTNGGNEGLSTSNGSRPGMQEISIDGLSISDPVNPSIGISPLALNTDSVQTLHLLTI